MTRPLLAAALLALGAQAAGLQAQEDARTREYRYLMGTSVSIEAFGAGEEQRRAAIEEAFAAVSEVDRLMSNYRDDSELSLINGRAAERAVPASDPTFSVLRAAQEVSRRSGGAFDVTVGPLVRLWGFHDRRPHEPSARELARVRPLVGYANVVLDARARTVRFRRRGVELDLGGIAKGFAAELAASVLRRHGLSGAVDAGGNQFMVGHPPGQAAWTVGIKHPLLPDQLLGVIEVPEGSLSTSGQYANTLSAGGRIYGHILDPRTLQPARAATLSVTVVSPDGTLGDALSKVAFVLGPRRGLDVIESFPGTSAVIAYRSADGSLATLPSRALAGRFHPAVAAR